MSMKVVCLVIWLPAIVLCANFQNRGDSCVTPNGEREKCIPLRNCQVIKDAVLTRDKVAIDFGRKSQCGYDSEPLVCCGKYAKIIERKPCTTPNGESATCLPLSSCPIIFNAMQTRSRDAIDFATRSKCESDNEYCCGTEAYPLRSRLLPDRSVCGLEKEGNRVWGGEETEIWEYPWMALLRYVRTSDNSDAGFNCGGTLINERTVLTAAHCVAVSANKGIKLDSVRLGEWKISSARDCENLANPECADPVIDLKIAKRTVHPRYDRRGGKNDIALLQLEKDVKFTSYVQPVCLPVREAADPSPRNKMWVVGWGATENDTYSDVKLKVEVPIVSREDCSKKIRQRGGVIEEQICAGGESGKDSCQGDSGGPLLESSKGLDTQPQWYQPGVVSWGVGCAVAGYPAIYTRVSKYMDWIIDNL